MSAVPVTPLREAAGSTAPDAALATLVNHEAEQRLLGAILLDNRAFPQAAAIVDQSHFSLAVHGRIFASIGTLIERGETADPVTLHNLFDQDEALLASGGANYLAQLAINTVTITNAADYARHIVDLSRRRSIVEVCADTIRAAAIMRRE